MRGKGLSIVLLVIFILPIAAIASQDFITDDARVDFDKSISQGSRYWNQSLSVVEDMGFYRSFTVDTGQEIVFTSVLSMNENQVRQSVSLSDSRPRAEGGFMLADEHVGNYQVEVEVGSYNNVSLWIEKDQGMYGNYETVNETAVTFYAFDSENFDFFRLGQSYHAEEQPPRIYHFEKHLGPEAFSNGSKPNLTFAQAGQHVSVFSV